jgi:general secretion pathway protein G
MSTQTTRPTYHRTQGFTLLELLVAMVITALLAGIVVPHHVRQIGKSSSKVAKAQIEALGQALDRYRLELGLYPGAEQGLLALRQAPQPAGRWQAPYLKGDISQDPVGRPYAYRRPGQHGEDDLLSLAADSQPSGDGEASDLTSW